MAYIIPALSIICNRTKTPSVSSRILLYSIHLMNIPLFLHLLLILLKVSTNKTLICIFALTFNKLSSEMFGALFNIIMAKKAN